LYDYPPDFAGVQVRVLLPLLKLKRVTANNDTTVMSNVTMFNADTIISALKKWNKKLTILKSAEGDSVIATAKSIDVTSEDLREMAVIIEKYDGTITLGRSGANFRMIFW
jgi:hypothetical protein